jgi:hypothetical protein
MNLFLLFSRHGDHLCEVRSMYRPKLVLDRGLEKVVHWSLRLGGSFHLHPSIVRWDRLYLVHLCWSAKAQSMMGRNVRMRFWAAYLLPYLLMFA